MNLELTLKCEKVHPTTMCAWFPVLKTEFWNKGVSLINFWGSFQAKGGFFWNTCRITYLHSGPCLSTNFITCNIELLASQTSIFPWQVTCISAAWEQLTLMPYWCEQFAKGRWSESGRSRNLLVSGIYHNSLSTQQDENKTNLIKPCCKQIQWCHNTSIRTKWISVQWLLRKVETPASDQQSQGIQLLYTHHSLHVCCTSFNSC